MTPTHCPYCAMQCGMHLEEGAGGVVVSERSFPTNRGGLCRKGWTSTRPLEHPERLRAPLYRPSRDAEFAAIGWDQALDILAARLGEIREEHGADANAVFGGGGLTNEKTYALGKFARVALGTRHIDYNGRYCMASAAAAATRVFGIDRGLPFPMSDIAGARTAVLVGANIAETMPPFVQWFEAMREAGGHLCVIDPRRTATARGADEHLQITPGTDIVLALGALHIAVEEGLVDEEFVAQRTQGFEEARSVAARYHPAHVEKVTGIDEAVVRSLVRRLAAGRAMVLTARGAEQHAHGSATAMAWINLCLALGLPGRECSGYGTITGQGNGQGGREHGQKSDQLPGYRKITDEADRAVMARHWGIAPEEMPGAGVSAAELIDGFGQPGGARSLWVMGSNLLVSSPDANHVRRRLEALDFLVVSDLFLSETAALAHLVLPAAQWAEEEGTMTNLEGRVLKRNRLRAPVQGVRTDLEAIAGVATRLGHGAKFSSAPREVFAELSRVTAGAIADYSGIDYEGIEANDGVFWPCPPEALSQGGTKRLFARRFFHPDGLARFGAVEFAGLPEEPCAEFPLFFTTGRTMAQYQSGTQTRRVSELNQVAGEAWIEVHPDLAREQGIEEGTLVRVVSRRGSMTARARLCDDGRVDTLFAPFHWSGAQCANALTIAALDPLSRMPSFKACAARLERVEGEMDAGGAI